MNLSMGERIVDSLVSIHLTDTEDQGSIYRDKTILIHRDKKWVLLSNGRTPTKDLLPMTREEIHACIRDNAANEVHYTILAKTLNYILEREKIENYEIHIDTKSIYRMPETTDACTVSPIGPDEMEHAVMINVGLIYVYGTRTQLDKWVSSIPTFPLKLQYKFQD